MEATALPDAAGFLHLPELQTLKPTVYRGATQQGPHQHDPHQGCAQAPGAAILGHFTIYCQVIHHSDNCHVMPRPLAIQADQSVVLALVLLNLEKQMVCLVSLQAWQSSRDWTLESRASLHWMVVTLPLIVLHGCPLHGWPLHGLH